jgi:hypothetical protein
LLLKLFHKIESEGRTIKSFYEANIALILKPGKDEHTKKSYKFPS